MSDIKRKISFAQMVAQKKDIPMQYSSSKKEVKESKQIRRHPHEIRLEKLRKAEREISAGGMERMFRKIESNFYHDQELFDMYTKMT